MRSRSCGSPALLRLTDERVCAQREMHIASPSPSEGLRVLVFLECGPTRSPNGARENAQARALVVKPNGVVDRSPRARRALDEAGPFPERSAEQAEPGCGYAASPAHGGHASRHVLRARA